MNIGIKFIDEIRKPIIKNANKAVLTKSMSIPSFKIKPVTLNGIPYRMSGFAMYSDSFGLFCPRKKPKIKKGIIFMNRE